MMAPYGKAPSVAAPRAQEHSTHPEHSSLILIKRTESTQRRSLSRIAMTPGRDFERVRAEELNRLDTMRRLEALADTGVNHG